MCYTEWTRTNIKFTSLILAQNTNTNFFELNQAKQFWRWNLQTDGQTRPGRYAFTLRTLRKERRTHNKLIWKSTMDETSSRMHLFHFCLPWPFPSDCSSLSAALKPASYRCWLHTINSNVTVRCTLHYHR